MEPFEHPPQDVGPRDADYGEDGPHLQVLRQGRVQPEDREDQDLRHDRDAVADDHVGDGLDQGHKTGLLHAFTQLLQRLVGVARLCALSWEFELRASDERATR